MSSGSSGVPLSPSLAAALADALPEAPERVELDPTTGEVAVPAEVVPDRPGSSRGAMRDLVDQGLAQALAAALWEADAAMPSPSGPVDDRPGWYDPANISGHDDLDPVWLPPAVDAVAPVVEVSEPPAWLADIVTARFDELVRLQTKQAAHVEKLHAENTRLRAGEVREALLPLVNGMLRLHDQMDSLGAAAEPTGVAGLLQVQLRQVLELTAGLTPFTVGVGTAFDGARHRGVTPVTTDDPGLVGTVAATVRPGFERADGAVVRVAEVEVYRLAPAPRRSSATPAAASRSATGDIPRSTVPAAAGDPADSPVPEPGSAG